MELAGIEGQIPPGLNKVDKTRAWLRLANESCNDPLKALGIALTEFMEVDSIVYAFGFDLSEGREKINRALGSYGLSYVKGGLIHSSVSTAVGKSLKDIIDARDLSGLQNRI